MAHDMDARSGRLRVLEQQVRVFKVIAVGAVVLAVVLATVPRLTAQQAVEQLRVRQLIVEDGDGRTRMVVGYLDAAGMPISIPRPPDQRRGALVSGRTEASLDAVQRLHAEARSLSTLWVERGGNQSNKMMHGT